MAFLQAQFVHSSMCDKSDILSDIEIVLSNLYPSLVSKFVQLQLCFEKIELAVANNLSTQWADDGMNGKK